MTVKAAVGGDASAIGHEVALGPVTGNLRAIGSAGTVGSVGSYVPGIDLGSAVGPAMPDGLVGKIALDVLGAFLALLVPVAGWFVVLGLTMMGIGTLAVFALSGCWMMRREGVQP